MKVAPSMLACDFANIGSEIKKISTSSADLIHLDIMDGIFVPNISFGPSVVKSMRKYTNLPFDVHLMIEDPHRYIEQFAKSGADIISFHIEAEKNVPKTLDRIKSFGVKPSLAIKPNTPVDILFPYLSEVYMILVMTVEPGFGGQSFMQNMMEKVTAIKNQAQKINKEILVEVDGGINPETAKIAYKYGVDICVAGTSVFNSKDTGKAIKDLKNPIL